MSRGIGRAYGSKIRTKKKRRVLGGRKIKSKKLKKASKR